MNLTGHNDRTGATFPVSVISETALARTTAVNLPATENHNTAIVLSVDTSGLGADEYIGLLVIVSAEIDDILTRAMFRPRVYDEWWPLGGNSRHRLRLAAPLTAVFWAAPVAMEVEMRLTHHVRVPSYD
ncbi:hypothetical protein [Curtobacterium sp. VKM Ac-1393]|uniref:hypothetical protein n=1 Tax=Curtobacterium sp. VKM Ac-1393 TaxID=2783814 RepID=UPI00188A55D5|nr:hypothetical protein [Curtobacterium sp. VKM Ac-1393]MBF4608924.1 hypothetical protein [Curtobacterium sp. VKM Ac-1393]